jgi:transglutaminase-like putative cysteine protease
MAFLKRNETAEALGVGYQIPRNSLALLMIAQAVVVLPHAAHITPWIVAVGLFCGCWRWMVFQGRWDYPQRWVKVLLVAASAIGVGVSGKNVFSLETATGLLIVAFALKLVEMKSRRDAYIVIHLCYFIIAAEFLFDQSIGVSLYGALSMIIVTAAFVGLHQLHTRVNASTSLRTAAVLVMQAIPLMLVLFLFFPRVAPLWSVPLPGGSRTGITENVAPGDIAALTRSDEIAFRVVFDGPTPAPRDLYWRGLVYSNFRLGTWSVAATSTAQENSPIRPGTHSDYAPDVAGIEPLSYQVLLEPTQASWLFALDVATPVARSTSVTRDFRLVADEPVHTMMRYQTRSYPGAIMDRTLPDWLRTRETQLPKDDNPRIVAFAKDLLARTDGPEAFVAAALQYIRDEPFFYTLNPPLLNTSGSVDAFWFDSRRGFCSHFAGALVYMARAVGIPARMIGGYQGGEVNPVTGHLVVRQYDAHAWAEVWFDGRGWVRVDPTAAVAPARIESGLDAALSETDRAVLSAVTGSRFDGVPGLRDVLYLFESVQHRWNLWVVGYDTEMQARYLADLLGEVTPTRVGLAMLFGGGVSLALVVLSLFWRRRPAPDHPAQRAFRRFAARVARSGMTRRPDETPAHFLRRVNAARNRSPSEVAALIDHLDALLYNPDFVCDQDALRRLRSGLRRLQVDVALRARS